MLTRPQEIIKATCRNGNPKSRKTHRLWASESQLTKLDSSGPRTGRGRVLAQIYHAGCTFQLGERFIHPVTLTIKQLTMQSGADQMQASMYPLGTSGTASHFFWLYLVAYRVPPITHEVCIIRPKQWSSIGWGLTEIRTVPKCHFMFPRGPNLAGGQARSGLGAFCALSHIECTFSCMFQLAFHLRFCTCINTCHHPCKNVNCYHVWEVWGRPCTLNVC